VTDTDHVAPGGSIDRKYLLGLISDLAGDVAGSISSAAGDLVAGGADEGSQASSDDARPDRRAVMNRQSPIPTIQSRRGFLAAGCRCGVRAPLDQPHPPGRPRNRGPGPSLFEDYLRLEDLGLRNRTPAPPPSSSINSIPAASSAFCSISRASSDTCGPNAPSIRLIVGRERPARNARSV
jgi:hypothetical protein